MKTKFQSENQNTFATSTVGLASSRPTRVAIWALHWSIQPLMRSIEMISANWRVRAWTRCFSAMEKNRVSLSHWMGRLKSGGNIKLMRFQNLQNGVCVHSCHTHSIHTYTHVCVYVGNQRVVVSLADAEVVWLLVHRGSSGFQSSHQGPCFTLSIQLSSLVRS